MKIMKKSFYIGSIVGGNILGMVLLIVAGKKGRPEVSDANSQDDAIENKPFSRPERKDEPSYEEPAQIHSRLGIASFTISIVVGICMMALFLIAGILEEFGELDEKQMASVLIGFGVIGVIFANLVGSGLGVAGLFGRDKKRVFSILGLIFNTGTIVITVLAIAFGLTQK
ncbi:hypothetical protein GTO36_09080 [bacterium]|nr:hypothetical protein [bacterium]